MTFKQKVHSQYFVLLQDKIDVFRDRITALTEDSKNDAKGSAGDKHETALSMMHIEQEKANHKLKEFLDQKAIFDRIDASAKHMKVAVGSLVVVNEIWLYVSTALSKQEVDEKTIFAISPQSPLGSGIMGKEAGFTFELNGKKYTVKEVF